MVWPPNGRTELEVPPADLDVYTLCCLDLGLGLWLHRNSFFMVKAAKRRSVSSVSVRSGRETGKTKVVAEFLRSYAHAYLQEREVLKWSPGKAMQGVQASTTIADTPRSRPPVRSEFLCQFRRELAITPGTPRLR